MDKDFCLTPVAEANLWYESLRTIVPDWNGLQAQFRQQNSIIVNTREQLFHSWRLFHFDENSQTKDMYVTHIRWVVAFLGYGKPQVLYIFKNTLLSRLYGILFSIEDLRQTVETAKIVFIKEKIGRQLAGQSTSIPFMSVKDSQDHDIRTVLFDNHGVLDKNRPIYSHDGKMNYTK